jgi:hypothetical protein
MLLFVSGLTAGLVLAALIDYSQVKKLLKAKSDLKKAYDLEVKRADLLEKANEAIYAAGRQDGKMDYIKELGQSLIDDHTHADIAPCPTIPAKNFLTGDGDDYDKGIGWEIKEMVNN